MPKTDPRETDVRVGRFDLPVDDGAHQVRSEHGAQPGSIAISVTFPCAGDPALLEQHDVVCEPDDFLEVMAHVDDRDRVPVAQRLEPGQQFLAPPRVERGERLVEQQEPWSRQERAAERHPLALSTRELVWPAAKERTEPQQRCGFGELRMVPRAACAVARSAGCR